MNTRPFNEAPLSVLMRKLNVSHAGRTRIIALVDQWRDGKDTVADMRRVFVEAAEYAAGECPEDDRAAVRWRRAFDDTCDAIDRALTNMRRM